jgi:hypothetical protein
MGQVTNNYNMQENADGTLTGGFVSITGGRYRVIIGNGNTEGFIKNNGECNNFGDCTDDNNEFKCQNVGKCFADLSAGQRSLSSFRSSF